MDNLTHSLVGLALAETGLKRLTPLATTTLILAANFPDIDIVTGLAGTLPYLEHHRGITHALIAIPPLSILLAVMVFAGSSLAGKGARFVPLAGLSLLAMLTHPLLDFLNSYGWRPFLPWNDQWYYGDTAFVIDPWIWAVVGGAMFLLTSQTRRQRFCWSVLFVGSAVVVMVAGDVAWWIRGVWMMVICAVIALRGWRDFSEPQAQRLSRGILLALLAYIVVLTGLHYVALRQARPLAIIAQQRDGGGRVELSALPVAARPLVWRVVVATEKSFHLTEMNLLKALPHPDSAISYLRERGDAETLTAVRNSGQAQRFLRFARFPVSEVIPFHPNSAPAEVEIRDVRFQPLSRSFILRIKMDKNLRPIVE